MQNTTDNVFISDIQFEADYDTVVIGGGTTGVNAALSAARTGAKTAIVEYYGFLGGFATSKYTWLGFHDKQKRFVVRGIPLEIVERVKAVGGATAFYFDPIWNSSIGLNTTWLKVILGQMAKAEGIHLYLHSLATGVKKAGNRVEGVYIHNKQGCQLLRAKTVIDCTDTCDAAVMAGAEYEFGRRKDGKPQVSSYTMDIGGIDMEELMGYFESHSDQIRQFEMDDETARSLISGMKHGPIFGMSAFSELVKQAVEDGVEFPRINLVGVGFPESGEMKLVTPRVENVNPNDVRNHSEAEMEGLRQFEGVMQFVNRYMPGGRKARLIGCGHTIGIRETRHIHGDYYLTGRDLVEGKRFDDVIALGAYHLDIHSPDHKGVESTHPPVYEIPYRSLLPKNLDNVLVAGRCISASHEASSSTRVIAISGAQGQAAGMAAALCALRGHGTRDLNVADLQNRLMENGAELGQGLGRNQ